MRRRPTLSLAVCSVLLLLLAAGGCGPEPVEQQAPRPNLLLIAVDTLRADRLGAYGYERLTSPNIDALLAGSVVFEDAWSESSWTLPSFATMFTSLHTSTHHCWNFRTSLDDSYLTLAEMLSGAGWDTAAVVSHEFMRDKYGLHQGFEHYDTHLAQAAAYSHQAISSPNVTNRTLRWMSERREAGEATPWFLWVHYFDPHLQYLEHAGSREFGTETDSDLYDGEIRFTDDHVGRLLQQLKAWGELDDTIIVFIADHGEEFGDHGGAKHGKTLYREVSRVPFAIRAPGVAPRRVDVPVSLVDVTPTLLELLDVQVDGGGFAGRSLVPLMAGQGEPAPPVLLELGMGGFSMRAVVYDRWKLIEIDLGAGGVRHQLYDRVEDPGELRNLAAEQPDVVVRLAELLADQVEAAAEVGRMYEQGAELQLDEDELQRLSELGYR